MPRSNIYKAHDINNTNQSGIDLAGQNKVGSQASKVYYAWSKLVSVPPRVQSADPGDSRLEESNASPRVATYLGLHPFGECRRIDIASHTVLDVEQSHRWRHFGLLDCGQRSQVVGDAAGKLSLGHHGHFRHAAAPKAEEQHSQNPQILPTPSAPMWSGVHHGFVSHGAATGYDTTPKKSYSDESASLR